jgi:hypothetical protein
MEQWNGGMMGEKDKPIIPLFRHSKSEMGHINKDWTNLEDHNSNGGGL